MSGVPDSWDNKKSVSLPLRGVKRGFLAINDNNNDSENSQKIKMLVETLKEKYFYQPDNIIFLTAEEAGEEQILAAMEDLIRCVSPGDTIVFRFSDDKILYDDRVCEKINILEKLGTRLIGFTN